MTRSLQDREAFWREQAAKIHWFQPPSDILTQDEDGLYRWFRGGQLNTAYLALDYHVEHGRGDQPALIYDSPVTGTCQQLHLPGTAGSKWPAWPGVCSNWVSVGGTPSSSICR